MKIKFNLCTLFCILYNVSKILQYPEQLQYFKWFLIIDQQPNALKVWEEILSPTTYRHKQTHTH